MPRLIVDAPGGSQELVLGDRLVAGRAEECDLILDDHRCSRQHCEFLRRDGDYVVKDLGSANGTSVNGRKLADEEFCALKDGDKIRIGAIPAVFHTRDADFQIRFESGEHEGVCLPLGNQRVTLGRQPKNDLAFEDINVSGVHLEIVREGQQHVLRDLGSTNGTLLDGRKVSEVMLSSGDRVRIGGSEFIYQDLRKGEPDSAASPSAGKVDANRALSEGQGKRKLGSIVALVVLLIAIGGGVWYALDSSGGSKPTSGREVAAMPAGSMLVEDWSFEDAGVAGSLWNNEGTAAFRPRRGSASSGSHAMAASVEGDQVALARRESITPGARALRITGAWEVDAGCLAGLSVLLRAEAKDREAAQSLALRVAQSGGTEGEYRTFEEVVHLPSWCQSVELLLSARGSGNVAVDDLAARTDSTEASRVALGDMALLSRGSSFVMRHLSAPLIELFSASGRMTGEDGERLDLPPGAFAMECRQDNADLTYTLGQGGPAPEELVAYVYPDVASEGITLLREGSSERHLASFDVEGVRAVLLGAAAERTELRFDPPVHLASAPRSPGLELRVIAPTSMQVSIRTSFEAERTEANQLLLAAQQDLRADRWGAALKKLQEVLTRLPYQQDTLDRVSGLTVEIRRKTEEEVEKLESERSAAVFLDSLERYRKVLDRADLLITRLEGAPVAEEIRVEMERIRARAEELTTRRREEEAARLASLVEFYSTWSEQDRSGTAAELRSALRESYAGTEVVRSLGEN